MWARHGQTDAMTRLRQRLMIGTVAAAALGTGLLYLIGQYATPDFLVLVAALIMLGGLVVYDIFSRRLWEATLSEQVQTLMRNHDRLVREVARNRSEIAILKEGLYDTALVVENEGKNQMPSSSVEAKMISAIVTRLAALGQKRQIPAAVAAAADDALYDKALLELQVTPPPPKAPPQTALEQAMDPKFAHYSDAMILNLLEQAVQNDRIDMFMQPVVSLPQRKTRMIEIFGRIRALKGSYLPAEQYMRLAEKEQLMTTIDNLLLLRCLQLLRSSANNGQEIPYMLNISPDTLNDTGFMGDLVTFLSQNREMAKHLIFELPQNHIDNMTPSLSSILDGLSQLGVRFSMDRVRNGKFDIHTLKSRHIRFVKFDADWLVKEAAGQGGANRIARLKTQLDSAGIDMIIEKVETEATLRELLDFGIDYGQGWHFGKPDLYTAGQNSRKVA